MKITEVWNNRAEFDRALRLEKPCYEGLQEWENVRTETDCINVLAKYFLWLVNREILEEWLPNKLMCETLHCSGCTGLTALPELPVCKELYCADCTGLTALPDLPMCGTLYCYGCTGLRNGGDDDGR